MRYKNVGRSGLKVSLLSLGSNNFGLQVPEDETIRIINKAIDLGINSIDTADIYTGGMSEEIIGKAVQGNRSNIMLATKIGYEEDISRKSIIAGVKRSLERLRTDYIDLYYIHAFHQETPLEETMSTLNELVQQGKLRQIACSNFSAEQMEMAREVCESGGYAQFVADQPEYNMIRRDAETGVIRYCLRENLGVFPYSPLMGGLLVGKYSKNLPAPAGSRGAYHQGFLASVDAITYSKLEKLKAIATKANIPLMELAVGWLLKKEAITSVVVGASKAAQLAETVAIVDRSISDDIIREVDELTD
ncbi:MAG: aldo/keto reductase [Thaumarchaeota archaeon]|nr:aldo/keto reductase [Nitrososphaerota archaeon]